jgi:hypothetical protein
MALHTEHRFFSILSFMLCSFMSLWIYLLQIGMLEGLFQEWSAMLKRSDEPGDGLILSCLGSSSLTHVAYDMCRTYFRF